MMKENNIIRQLSKDFALRIVKMCHHLSDKRDIYPLTKQVLRSGTSIGANVAESVYAQSRADFINKYQSIMADNKYIIGTLVNIIKSSKNENVSAKI